MKPITAIFVLAVSASLLTGYAVVGQSNDTDNAGADASSNAGDTITRTATEDRPSQTLADPYFTGDVRVDSLFDPSGESRVGGALVTFDPGERTAWHTHPAGQTLIGQTGAGWVQQEGGSRVELNPGDVVQIPAGVKHWHGARADKGMTHIALQETIEGENVQWLELVTDEQYQQD